MEIKLARIAEVTRGRPKGKFASFAHLIYAERLDLRHYHRPRVSPVGACMIKEFFRTFDL